MSRSLVGKGIRVLRDEGLGPFLMRLSARLKHEWAAGTFRPHTSARSIAGEHIQVHIADLFGQFWYGRPHEWKELVWVRDHLLRPGDIAIDVGTNHGITGVLFARWVGLTGRVIGFDGLPSNVEAARINANLNGASNFEVRHAALGSAPGQVRFVKQPNGAVWTEGQGDVETIEVPLVRLDDELQGGRADFLKIDVEGYEAEVLRGARDTLKQVPSLDLEIHCACFPDAVAGVREVLALLPLERYEIHWQWTFDGEIVANDPGLHTPEHIAGHGNVHMFGRRR